MFTKFQKYNISISHNQRYHKKKRKILIIPQIITRVNPNEYLIRKTI